MIVLDGGKGGREVLLENQSGLPGISSDGSPSPGPSPIQAAKRLGENWKRPASVPQSEVKQVHCAQEECSKESSVASLAGAAQIKGSPHG